MVERSPLFAPSPLASPGAVLSGEHWRITVLTEGLVRLEWSPDGGFEDRASTLAIHRDLPVPAFAVSESDGALEIVTSRFRLTYDRGPFSPSGLSLQVRGDVSTYHSVWRYSLPADDLRGTARTLDGIDGRLPLGPGVLSRWGFSVLDDSASMLFADDGWVATREPGRIDLYVFAHGHDYAAALADFGALSGRPPVLPRWALGNWWSRYHAYTDAEYLALMDRFAAEGLPFSVAVVDMDWHRVGDVDPVYGSGWTGYSWNRTLFPDPVAFLADLHRRGLRVTLNVHPADGVRAFEDAYPAMCRALGRDPAAGEPILFDPTDRRFLEAYFSVLHRGLENQGVDFFWIDWQSGPYSRLDGIDPLWMLNHFHFLDSGTGGRRALTFSRYAGPGSHRYPVGFSGDSVISWASLEFQPEFTATASNIGYGWWSHDIGGHWGGRRDDELTARWVQLGVYSPILRLHSSANPFLVKEPWNYPPEAAAAIRGALRWRHQLVPYLHTANHVAARTSVPLVRPLYQAFPDAAGAYAAPDQFLFGSELLVAPITAPRDPVTLLGSARAWLPPGSWTDIVTGAVYDGDRSVDLHRDSTSIPVLLREGGILPVAGPDDRDAAANPTHLDVLVAPGKDGRFVLYEDDGTGQTVHDIPTATTTLTWDQAAGALTIGAATGPPGIVPELRTWTVTLLGVTRAPAGLPAGSFADPRAGSAAGPGAAEPDRVRMTVADVPTDRATTVVFGPDPIPSTAAVPDRIFALLNRAQCEFTTKTAVWEAVTSGRPVPAVLATLLTLDLPGALLSAVTELLTVRGGPTR